VQGPIDRGKHLYTWPGDNVSHCAHPSALRLFSAESFVHPLQKEILDVAVVLLRPVGV